MIIVPKKTSISPSERSHPVLFPWCLWLSRIPASTYSMLPTRNLSCFLRTCLWAPHSWGVWVRAHSYSSRTQCLSGFDSPLAHPSPICIGPVLPSKCIRSSIRSHETLSGKRHLGSKSITPQPSGCTPVAGKRTKSVRSRIGADPGFLWRRIGRPSITMIWQSNKQIDNFTLIRLEPRILIWKEVS